ncbi:MAG: hypothetical protein HWN51_05700, partial [Desulfobacterales bacterium]|nr:hypothetical protein [Desulfobacterales bacterium]
MGKGFIRNSKLIAAIVCVFSLSITATQAQSFLDIARETGVTIGRKGDATIWNGPVSGKTKLNGPLAGKTIGVLVASEFSDF